MRFLTPINLYMTNMLEARALVTTPLPYDEGLPHRAGCPANTRGQRTSRQYHLRVPTCRTFRRPRPLEGPSGNPLPLLGRLVPEPRPARSASLPSETTRPTRPRVPSTAMAVIRTLEDPLPPTCPALQLTPPIRNGTVLLPRRSTEHPCAPEDQLPPAAK